MKITVVIPCRNEVAFIEECVRAIYASNLTPETTINVFIVDGKSDDGTLQKIEDLQDEFASLQMVVNEAQITPFAFNLGIHAGGEADFVQIVGARQIISPNYLHDGVEFLLENQDVWCVGGRVHNEYINEAGEIIARTMATTFGMGLGNFRTLTNSGFTDTVGTPLYPYWVFEKLGFFDEQLIRNQDDDFNFRVTEAGGKIYYLHSIEVKYYVRGNYTGLRRQFYQYGYWKVFVNRKHQAVTTKRQLVPPLFVAYALTLPFAWILGWKFGVLWHLPIFLYLVMNIKFAISTAQKGSEILSIVKCYLILHFSYGWGYLHGIWDFLIRKKNPAENQQRLSR